MPAIIDKESVIIETRQGKTLISLNDECQELAFPYLLPNGKFGYNVARGLLISQARYFNQRLLNYNQTFVSDTNYYYFFCKFSSRTVLRSLINFAMHRIKQG